MAISVKEVEASTGRKKQWISAAKELADRRCSSSVLYARSIVQKVMGDRGVLTILWEKDCAFLEQLFGSLSEAEQKLAKVLYEGVHACGLPQSYLQDNVSEVRVIARKSKRWFILYQEDWPLDQILTIDKILQDLTSQEGDIFWSYYLHDRGLKNVARILRTEDLGEAKKAAKTVAAKVRANYLVDDQGFFTKKSDELIAGCWLAEKIGYKSTSDPAEASLDLEKMVRSMRGEGVPQTVILSSQGVSQRQIAKQFECSARVIATRMDKAQEYSIRWIHLTKLGHSAQRKATILEAFETLRAHKLQLIFWESIVYNRSAQSLSAEFESPAEHEEYFARVVSFLKGRYTCDEGYLPLERQPLVVKEKTGRGNPVGQKLYLHIWALSGEQTGKIPYDTSELVSVICADVPTPVIYNRLFSNLDRMEKAGWIRRVKERGSEYLEVTKVDYLLSAERSPENQQHRTPGRVVNDQVWHNDMWFSLKDLSEEMVKILLTEAGDFSPGEPFPLVRTKLGRKALLSLYNFNAGANHPVIVSLGKYCQDLGIIVRDDALSKSKRDSIYRLGQSGKRLLEKIKVVRG